MTATTRIQIDTSYDSVTVVRLLDKRLSDPLQLDEQRRELLQLLKDSSDCRKFILDFSGVAFLITNALNNLLVFNAQITRDGGRLVLCGMTPHLREIFRRTCLEGHVFQIQDTLEEALEAIRG